MSLAATLMDNFKPQALDFDSHEFRITEGGCLSAFQQQSARGSSWMTPETTEMARRSRGVSVEIPVINYEDVTIRTTRPVTITDAENTSALYTVTWTTYAFGFKMYPAQHGTNDISLQKDFDRKMSKMIVKMRAAMDTTAEAALDAGKTQIIGQLVDGLTFPADVLTETLPAGTNTRESYLIHNLGPTMTSNDFDRYNMDVIGNPGIESIVTKMEGFGQANSENKRLTFAGKNFLFSNNIANGATAGTKGTGYAVADGTLGFLTRVEQDSLLGTSLRSGHNWGTVFVPGLGLTMGTYEYDESVDASTPTGQATLTRAGATVMDFAVDVAYVTAYNSAIATTPTAIIKFDQIVTP